MSTKCSWNLDENVCRKDASVIRLITTEKYDNREIIKQHVINVLGLYTNIAIKRTYTPSFHFTSLFLVYLTSLLYRIYFRLGSQKVNLWHLLNRLYTWSANQVAQCVRIAQCCITADKYTILTWVTMYCNINNFANGHSTLQLTKRTYISTNASHVVLVHLLCSAVTAPFGCELTIQTGYVQLGCNLPVTTTTMVSGLT